MSETNQVAVLVITGLIIGVIGIILITVLPPLFESDLTISSYEATLYENGTLAERYTYDVETSGKYHMLYRLWEEPLLFTTPVWPSIMMVSVTPPSETIGYVKDNSGNVTVYGDPSAAAYKPRIGQEAQYNEMGVFSPRFFHAGRYTTRWYIPLLFIHR